MEPVTSGYLHPDYAQSLAEFGTPQKLSHSGGWILVRPISGVKYYDGIGCYPLFTCKDWSQLETDIEDLAQELVTVSLVTDPFGNFNGMAFLQRYFKDCVQPFKEHFVVDLNLSPESFISSHHRRNIRKALSHVHVECCEDPLQFLDQWINLYAELIERHRIKGIPAFSSTSFIKQLRVPGITMFRAVHNNSTVGITLWYTHANFGYYHLGAYSAAGYKLHASFALFWFAIRYFTNMGLRWLNLGAGAGIRSDGKDGLSRFKQGWSTGTRTAYLCGRIFDPVTYSKISTGGPLTEYFPAYRSGEFV